MILRRRSCFSAKLDSALTLLSGCVHGAAGEAHGSAYDPDHAFELGLRWGAGRDRGF